MTEQRILMLDFDGVINTDRTYDRAQEHAIERRLAQRVGQMVTALKAQVVVSSDWRRFYGLSELRQILHRYARIEPRHVIGATSVDEIRGEEIQKWLRTHNRPVRLAILDDNHLGRFNMDVVRPWFVQTHAERGVSQANINKASTLLTTGPVWTASGVEVGV